MNSKLDVTLLIWVPLGNKLVGMNSNSICVTAFLSDFKVYLHRELEKNSPFQVPFSSRNNEPHKSFPKFNKCNQMCLYFLQQEWAGGAEDAITP